MPNNGFFWTTDQLEQLKQDYMDKSEDVSDNVFCDEWCKSTGRTANGVRGQLSRMKRRGLINNRSPFGEDPIPKEKEWSQVDFGDSYINVICASRRIKNQEDAIKEFGIDTNIWKVVKCRVKTSEGYRKDRKVKWKVTDGKVTTGDVDDSGKMLVVPLYHLELRMERRTDEIRAAGAIQELLEDARKHVPRVPKIKYPKNKDACLFEISIPDIHFGRLAWGEESGDDYDVKIAHKLVTETIRELLTYTAQFTVGRILFPIGNDYFNVNSQFNTTVKGTPQQEDTRWKKTFKLGRVLAVEIIDACASIAPVDVMVIPGNHDEEKVFYMGDALECWYHNDPNVSVNNSAPTRKYYLFGKNLIGFAHGTEVSVDRLPLLMPIEEPELWQKSTNREWHMGHIHTKRVTRVEADESSGIVMRSMRSLTAADAWTFNHGFVGNKRAAEALLWHPENGLVAQFTSYPKT